MYVTTSIFGIKLLMSKYFIQDSETRKSSPDKFKLVGYEDLINNDFEHDEDVEEYYDNVLSQY